MRFWAQMGAVGSSPRVLNACRRYAGEMRRLWGCERVWVDALVVGRSPDEFLRRATLAVGVNLDKKTSRAGTLGHTHRALCIRVHDLFALIHCTLEIGAQKVGYSDQLTVTLILNKILNKFLLPCSRVTEDEDQKEDDGRERRQEDRISTRRPNWLYCVLGSYRKVYEVSVVRFRRAEHGAETSCESSILEGEVPR